MQTASKRKITLVYSTDRDTSDEDTDDDLLSLHGERDSNENDCTEDLLNNNTNMSNDRASSDDGKQDAGEYDDDQMASGPSEDEKDRTWLRPETIPTQSKNRVKTSKKAPVASLAGECKNHAQPALEASKIRS